MSNSDNVVRGGLTTKHVDVDELLRVVDCTPVAAAVQTAAGDDHRFVCPVPDFSLRRLVVDDRVVAEPEGPEIVVVTEGEVQMTRPGDAAGAGPCTLRAGTSAWVPAAGGAFTIDGAGVVYRCGVGPA